MTDDLLPRLPDESFQRVLCVAAHPDDLEYGISGAVSIWTARGVNVRYLMLTRGEAGIDGMDPDEAREVRTADEVAAAEVVGVEGVDFLDLADGELEYGLPIRRDIAAAIRRYRPDTVVVGTWELASPWGLNHADHRVAGLATVDAIRDAGNRWVFRDLVAAGLEPWSVRRLLISGDSEPTHGMVLDADTVKRAVASLEAHAGYLAALPWHPPAEDTIQWVSSMGGTAMGVPNAATFRLWQMSQDSDAEPTTAEPSPQASAGATDAQFENAPIGLLEDDETIPPRPEEELADLERSDPA